MDILEMKLAAGVQIRDYVKTYGDRKNEAGAFAKYVKAVFKQEFQACSQTKRPFICYETAAINHQATSVIIGEVRDSILRSNFATVGLLS